MDKSDEIYARGLATRQAVLGRQHVEEAQANVTPLTEEWMDFVTRYAFGEIWSRPGLPHKTRSMLSIVLLTALDRHEELAAHIRATRNTGVSRDEVKEVLMQAAIYVGVPAAMSAFACAKKVYAEMDKEQAP